MIKPAVRGMLWLAGVVLVIGLAPQHACAQGPGAAEEGLPWQVGALFTVNWVLAAVAVAVMSRPIKRLEKPKKIAEDLEA